jgi:hypothetical protein
MQGKYSIMYTVYDWSYLAHDGTIDKFQTKLNILLTGHHSISV